jgi:tetratricopeptide (TPR) repeat protein
MLERMKNISRACIECDGGCGRRNASKRCSKCRTVYYCSVDCQRRNWAEHKPYCIPIEGMRQRVSGIGAVVPEESSAALAVNTDCGICLAEPMTKPVVLKECRHGFCVNCITTWQKHLKREGQTEATCPLCRADAPDVEEGLILRAMQAAERANKKGIDPEESQRYLTLALEETDKLLAIENPSLQVYNTKAEIEMKLGEARRAIETLEQVIQIDNQRLEQWAVVDEYMEQVEEARRIGDEDEQERLLNIVEEFMKRDLGNRLSGGKARHVPLYLMQADAHQQLEEWKEAVDIYKSLFQLLDESHVGTPAENRKLFTGLARCAYEMGNYDQAIAGFSAAIEMNPNFQGVYKYMALSYKAKGDLDKAIETMNKAVLYETPWDEKYQVEAFKLYEELCAERDS